MTMRGITAKNVQDYLNLGCVKSVYRWLDGKRNPSFDTLEQLSIVFERTMSYILGESDDPSSPELDEKDIQQLGLWSLEEDYMEIMMKYLRLDERGKAAVDALINAEFNMCKADETLLPRENYQLTIKVKG